jgi:hypothetical protein
MENHVAKDAMQLLAEEVVPRMGQGLGLST